MLSFLGRQQQDVLSAHLVPFRSPRWADLPNKPAALAFARKIWGWLLTRVSPEVIACVGHEVGRQLAPIMGVRNLRPMPTGWGNYTLLRGDVPSGAPFVALPHLGTFKLFGSEKYEPFLRHAFAPTARPD